MENANTHILMDLFWIEGSEDLITHKIWYFSRKSFVNFFSLFQLLKGQHLFLPCIFLLEAVKYQHNLMMNFWERGRDFTESLYSHILQYMKPLLYTVSLIHYV